MLAYLANTLPSKLFLSAGAALVCAWLLVGFSDARHFEAGMTLLVGDNPANRTQAVADFRSAQLLNLSFEPDQYEAVALWKRGDHVLAERKIRAILLREPENREAWIILSGVLKANDPAQAAAALARATKLNGKPIQQG
jgi:hypothetical protein